MVGQLFYHNYKQGMAVNLFADTNGESNFVPSGRFAADFTINRDIINSSKETIKSLRNRNQTGMLYGQKTPILSGESKFSIIPVWLRDTYARIQPTPIYDLQGPLIENINSEIEARDSLVKGMKKSNIFVSGADVFSYLNRNLNREVCNQTVTIVIHSLRDLYWNNRRNLSQEVVSNLEISLRDPLPTFKNVFEYQSIRNLSESVDLPVYQMFGTITPFSVLHIPVSYFIEALNAKAPIQIYLENTNIIIQLDYEEYDFWDTITESLVDYIDIQSKCDSQI